MVARAAEPEAASRLQAFERTFWHCDRAATRQVLDLATAAACSQATEELKKTRFGGDFDAMLAWWRQHKAAEHAALDAVERTHNAPLIKPAADAGPAGGPP